MQNEIRKTIYSLQNMLNIIQKPKLNARRSTAATYIAQGNMPRKTIIRSNFKPVAENSNELVENWLQNNSNNT